jgi:hypothetical protein
MWKIIVLMICMITGNLQAHWFNVSAEVSDKALKELSTFHKFGENQSIAIHPMAQGKAIAIYHGYIGWFSFSKAYCCYFYDGEHWSPPCKISDYNPSQLYHFSHLGTQFECNEKNEAYFAFMGEDESMQICQLCNGSWTSPISVDKWGALKIDLCGAALVKAKENKIFCIRDMNVNVEDLENAKNTSELIKDSQGNLCYLALVEDTVTEKCLIEERAWDGFCWSRTVLAEVEKPSKSWLALNNTKTTKLAIWQVEYPNLVKRYSSSSNTLEGWSLPELFDEDRHAVLERMLCLNSNDTILFVWDKGQLRLASKIWRNGCWEDTQLIEANGFYSVCIRGNSKGQASVFWTSFNVQSLIDKEAIIGKAAIWDGHVWSAPSTIFKINPPDSIDFFSHDPTQYGIDNQGNIIVAWHLRDPLYFMKTIQLYCSTYSNNRWVTNIRLTERNAGVPFLFNYKGMPVLSWIENADTVHFCFYKNGRLSEHFNANTKQEKINCYMNLEE